MWNRYRRTADFTDGKPWVLRFFDQIRFFPVTADELRQLREEFPPGRYRLKVEETVFRLQDYNRFLRENAASIAAFKATQQVAPSRPSAGAWQGSRRGIVACAGRPDLSASPWRPSLP
jgi:urea carboxylase